MKEVFGALWGKIEQVNKGKSTIYTLLFVTTVTRWITGCMHVLRSPRTCKRFCCSDHMVSVSVERLCLGVDRITGASFGISFNQCEKTQLYGRL